MTVGFSASAMIFRPSRSPLLSLLRQHFIDNRQLNGQKCEASIPSKDAVVIYLAKLGKHTAQLGVQERLTNPNAWFTPVELRNQDEGMHLDIDIPYSPHQSSRLPPQAARLRPIASPRPPSAQAPHGPRPRALCYRCREFYAHTLMQVS